MRFLPPIRTLRAISRAIIALAVVFFATTGLDTRAVAEPRDETLTRLVLEIEHSLLALGYDPGALDGRIDGALEEAVARFRRDRDLPGGRVLDVRLVEQLRGAVAMAPARRGPAGEALGSPRDTFDRHVLPPVREPGSARAVSEPSPLPQSRTAPLVAEIQTLLREVGFYRGPIDGIAGPATMEAVDAFVIGAGFHYQGFDALFMDVLRETARLERSYRFGVPDPADRRFLDETIVRGSFERTEDPRRSRHLVDDAFARAPLPPARPISFPNDARAPSIGSSNPFVIPERRDARLFDSQSLFSPAR